LSGNKCVREDGDFDEASVDGFELGGEYMRFLVSPIENAKIVLCLFFFFFLSLSEAK